MRYIRYCFALVAACALSLAACGDDDVDEATDQAERAAERVADEAGDARESAEDGLATLRTAFERLVDEASSGDDEAREKLLDDCRDNLEDLRQADDPRAERVGALCERIRSADDGNAWKEIKEEFAQIDGEN